MSNYSYLAVDPHGSEMRGTLDVADQAEALRRIKEMGLFPTRLLAAPGQAKAPKPRGVKTSALKRPVILPVLGQRVGSGRLSVFTRQLATLVEAGMPLLRGLRVLEEQEENPALKHIIGQVSESIESGNSLSDALAAHPKVFNRLYLNMAKAGEIGGALEITLRRLAEFMEKAQKLKGKVKAAMFYPCAVLCVASGVVTLMMTYVVPRFRQVFEGLGGTLPPFTVFIFRLSEAITHHLWMAGAILGAAGLLVGLALRTAWGRWTFDRLKLGLPIVGKLFRKLAISRFARTLGTLVSNGVPILQALTIVRETAGNVVVGRVVATVHDRVKEGEPMAPTLKASSVFPLLVAGMVDVGEQTGALPEMLMKIADNYDEEVDNATSALTSILEPLLIVLLAVVVGSIVIAMFLPILNFNPNMGGAGGEE